MSTLKITIVEIKEVEVAERSTYNKIKTEYISDVEFRKMDRAESKEFKPNNETGGYSRDVYGYAPDRLTTKIVETKIYEQVVPSEGFDLAKIITQINS